MERTLEAEDGPGVQDSFCPPAFSLILAKACRQAKGNCLQSMERGMNFINTLPFILKDIKKNLGLLLKSQSDGFIEFPFGTC